MIFNDLAFLFLFLPLTFGGFLLSPRSIREPLLLLASLVFYGLAGLEHVLVLLACIAWVWAFTASDATTGSRWRLIAAMAGPLAILVYYKYLGFIVRDVLGLTATTGAMAAAADKLLPAGISFFTFHLLSFALDRFHGTIGRQPAPLHFMIYIAFFPHLVAGPILRFHEISDALDGLRTFWPRQSHLQKAIIYFCCGLAAKVLIADGLAAFIQPLATHPGALTPSQALFVTVAYSFQIYFDFWGYTLMATGLGHLFGFQFPRNFNRPYDALNPKDFWRRWHMTLSRWFRDYLYIPIGGNQAYVRNILVVFMVCGLWHGAAWQFVVWGLYHGLMIVAYFFTHRWWDACPRLVQQGFTFLLVSMGWVLFLFNFSDAWQFLHSLAGFGREAHQTLPLEAWAMLALAAGACFGIDVDRLVTAVAPSRLAAGFYSAVFASVFALGIIFIDRSNSFIYFRF